MATPSRRSSWRERASIFRRPSGLPSNSLQNMGVKSIEEAYFVFAVGILLSLNSGYVNGLCLSGLLAEGGSDRQGVTAFTGTYTKSGLALAEGDPTLFAFEITLVLAFVMGSALSGALNPRPVPYSLAPSYGPTFLVGSLCMIAAAAAAAVDPGGRALYYFAAAANGVQNGMTSMYSANLIRTTHLTGTSTDIGLILGQMLRGNWKNFWKFKVLVGLATSFWLGGLVSFYAASAFLSRSLWFSAALFLTIGLTHVLFVIATEKVSFIQACVGSWEWDKVLDHMATSMTDGKEGSTILDLNREKVDSVFDQIDQDGSGKIDAEELKEALQKMGFKLTTQNIVAMIAVVDDNGDGAVDRMEFHALVEMATARARRRRGATGIRRASVELGIAWQQKSATAPAASVPADGALSFSEDGSHTGPRGSPGTREHFPRSGEPLGADKDLAVDITEALGAPSARRRLPRSYEEALGAGASRDRRAIIVTEARPPYAIVGVNGPWEELCGYRAAEGVGKSMGGRIQGPQTNREGLKQAMSELADGAERVECTTVNYRKDRTMFNNFLEMGPMYEEGSDDTAKEDEVAYYVGILTNLGGLAQDINGAKKEKEVLSGEVLA